MSFYQKNPFLVLKCWEDAIPEMWGRYIFLLCWDITQRTTVDWNTRVEDAFAGEVSIRQRAESRGLFILHRRVCDSVTNCLNWCEEKDHRWKWYKWGSFWSLQHWVSVLDNTIVGVKSWNSCLVTSTRVGSLEKEQIPRVSWTAAMGKLETCMKCALFWCQAAVTGGTSRVNVCGIHGFLHEESPQIHSPSLNSY